MKQLALSICLVMSGLISAYSAVWTVNNQSGMPADFAAISEAITAATDGDTIYIQPSPSVYSSFNLNKRLVLLGAGHNPEFSASETRITAITILNGAGQSVIKGIWTPNLSLSGGNTVHNLIISGCRIDAQTPMNIPSNGSANNWIFEENVFVIQSNSVVCSGLSNAIFRNNIFWTWNSSGQVFSSLNNSEISHNLFIQTNATSSAAINSGSSNLTFTDNIILRVTTSEGSTLQANCTACSWSNNLTYSTGMTLSDLPGNNLNNQTPEFVNVVLTSPEFDYSKDYRLTQSSPGAGEGSDGTDVGPFGGILQFSPFGYDDGMPRIGAFSLESAAAPQGGTITINLRAYGSGQE